ncbi:glycosyltransferase family 2 protein [Escherichia albertii]
MELNSELISVVITFFSNDESSGIYLTNSVSSALNQTYKNIEVLVIDDCSPIKASSCLNDINDSRLSIIRLPENGGMAAAINYGIELSSGKFIAFLDFDDLWYDFKLKEQFELIKIYIDKKLADPEQICCYSKVLIKHNNYEYSKPYRSIEKEEHVSDYLFTNRQFMQTSGMLISKSLLVKVKGMDAYKRHTDYQLVLKLYKENAIFIYYDKISYVYRIIDKKGDFRFSQDWLCANKWMMTDSSIRSFKVNTILRSMIDNYAFSTAFMYSVSNKFILSFFSYFIRFVLKKTLPSYLSSMLIKYKNKPGFFIKKREH